MGEHGDSEVLAWSRVNIGGLPLDDYCRERDIDMSAAVRAEIDDRVRNAAYHIIAGKNATYYGIGSALARLVDIVLHDQRNILTVCTPAAQVAGVRDVTVSMPRLVGGNGAMGDLPLALDPAEEASLHASAALIRRTIDELDASGGA